MRPAVAVAVVVLLAGSLAGGAAARAGAGGGDGPAEAAKRFREAFKPLKLAAPAKIAKDLEPRLPEGIVTVPEPFQALVSQLLQPFEAQLAEREAAVAQVGAGDAADAAAVVLGGLKALEAENADIAERLAGVEASYAEVWDVGYMESGEKQHRQRKSAAVLVPFYRTLEFRNGAIAARAAEALAQRKDGPRVAALVAASTDPSPAVRAAAVQALGRTGAAEALAALKRAAGADAVPAVRSRALAALCAWKVTEMKDAAVAAIGDAAWEVRSLAVAICARAKLVEAAGPLIDALAKEDGRLGKDIDDALHALLGVRCYGDVELWRRWWADNQAAVAEKARALAEAGAYENPVGPPESWDEPGGTEDGAAEGGKRSGATASFYGIDTTSRRVLFVIDMSTSMEQPAVAVPAVTGTPRDPYLAPAGTAKIDVAKWQLHRAVHALPAGAVFNIVVYSESYKEWQPQMTEVSAKAKAKAHEFIDGIKPNGTTNICDSLDEAFELAGAAPLGALGAKYGRAQLAADTVYLLSDGDPNRGRVTDIAALSEDVVARARAARIVIHAVGIGEVAGSRFLASLAKRTGGRYVGFR